MVHEWVSRLLVCNLSALRIVMELLLRIMLLEAGHGGVHRLRISFKLHRACLGIDESAGVRLDGQILLLCWLRLHSHHARVTTAHNLS